MNRIFTCIHILLLFGIVINSLSAQVTIGAGQEPRATLDIVGVPSTSTPAGVLIPRLTGDQIESMIVDGSQNSLLVYATAVSTTATFLIDEIGFWYYDSVDATWKPLNNRYRKAKIIVNSDGTGDYKTLQEAYDGEAKKLYSPILSNSYLEFDCQSSPGSVGSLDANGAIPAIMIRGGMTSSATVTFGKITIKNTTANFRGIINAENNTVTITNSYVDLNNGVKFTSGDLILNKSLFEVKTTGPTTVSSIKLNQSAFDIEASNCVININSASVGGEGTAGILLQASSSFKGLTSTVINFGGAGFRNYMIAEDASYYNLHGIINANINSEESIIVARQYSSVVIGSIVFNTGVTSKNLFYAISGGNILHFRGYLSAATTGTSIVSSNGGSIFLGGDRVGYIDDNSTTVIHSRIIGPGASSGSGLRADTGNIRMGLLSSTSQGLYEFDGFMNVNNATAGGVISTMNRVTGANYTTFNNLSNTGTIYPNGSAIYVEQ